MLGYLAKRLLSQAETPMMHVTIAKPQPAMSASIIHESRPDLVAAGPTAPSEPAQHQTL